MSEDVGEWRRRLVKGVGLRWRGHDIVPGARATQAERQAVARDEVPYRIVHYVLDRWSEEDLGARLKVLVVAPNHHSVVEHSVLDYHPKTWEVVFEGGEVE